MVPRFAQDGVLDLRDWDFQRDGTVVLRGEAQLYWGRLYTPQTIEQADPAEMEIIQASSNWNYTSEHPALGWGTYRMHVLLPRADLDLGLYLANQDTSYALWLNGELVSANGVVSSDPAEAVPQYLRRVVFYHASRDTLDLLLQVSNHHIRCGGWGNGIEIGTPSSAEADNLRTLFLGFGPALCLSLLGIYHFLDFLLRPREKAYLYYALFLLVVAVWTVFAGEYVFYRIFPTFPWAIGFRTQYIACDLFLLLLFLYFGVLFPREFPRTPLRVLAGLTAALALVKAIIPVYALSVYLTVFTHVYPVALGAVGCVLLVLAAVRRRENSLLILSGLAVLLLLWLYDTLAINQVIRRSTGSLLPHGFFGFVLLHSVVLARRFALAYGRHDYLTQHLEREVDRRTRELTVSKAALEEADRSRTDFFLHLSHEVRTPLTLIMNTLDEYAAQHSADQALCSLRRNLELLLAEITELFDVARIEKGIHVYRRDVRVDLTRLVRRKLDICRSDARARGMELTETLQAEVIARIDPVAADRVLNNLLTNAIKYNHPGGSIAVSLACAENRITLEVADTGPGIPAEQRSTAFLPYRRLSAAAPGLGVGLTVVKSIVESFGGTVEVRDNAGGGSVFAVSLPHEETGLAAVRWADEEMETPAAPVEARGGAPAGAPLLLIVDDNAQIAELLRARLTGSYRVRMAQDAGSALEMLESMDRPDLIISDVVMEGTDGLAFLEQVKRRPWLKEVPFLFLTAVTLDDSKRQAYDLGALDYIAKPFRLNELESKIRSILEHQALRKETEERRRFAGLGVLVSAFAHEIFNPLSGITGPLEVIRKRLPQDLATPELHRCLAHIDDSARRIERLVHTIRDIHAGRPPQIEVILIREAVDRAIERIGREPAAQVTWDVRIPPEARLEGNAVALEQILRNVLVNAVEAMPGAGAVRIDYRVESHRSVLTVCDSGCGPAKAEQVFDPFYTSKREDHMGMGLYIVRVLCDRMGWTCDLRPAGERGAVFSLVMPREGSAP